MKKEILDEKVYYYEDGVKNFEQLMQTLTELEDIYKSEGKAFWGVWTSSNNKDYIYGETKSFDINDINSLDEPVKTKMKYVFDTITESFYDISKDYAESIGDYDSPNLFPTFNIKKYNTGMAMGSHFDQLDGDTTLRYSLVMYLNDDCKGGEISFRLGDYDSLNTKPSPELDYDIAVKNKSIDFGVKPKAGSIIIFPASAPYFHTAHTVKSGIKYMVPGHWIHNNMNFNTGQSQY